MHSDDMEKSLDDLQAQFKALHIKLARQGDSLQQGYPPDDQLIEEIRECKNRFYAIKEALLQLSDHYDLSMGEQQSIGTTSDLVQLWGNIRPLLEPAREESSATQALAVPLAAPTGADASVLLELIEGLIRGNKLEPAFWLSAYYELLYEATAPVPPLWLRMIETSRYVGEHHPEAVNALGRFYSQNVPVNQKEPAFQWLAFAAALLPGVYAPSSGADRVLDKLDALPQELHNLIAMVLKAQPEKALPENAHMESLAGEAQLWLEQNRQLNPASPLAARLWVSMQEENGLISKLLGPICANDRTQQEDVSQLVKYLENEACQKKELAMQYQIMLKKFRILLKNQSNTEFDVFHISGSGMILKRLQDALKLARRWLDTPAGSDGSMEALLRGLPKEKWDAAVSQARNIINNLAGQQQESILLEMAISLAKQTLDRFAESISGENPLMPDTGLGIVDGGNGQLFPEPGVMPSNEAIEQTGKAIFNYFNGGLDRTGEDRDHNKISENPGLKKLLAKDDSGIAEFLRDLVSQQEKDLLKDMLKEEEGNI